MALNSLDYQKIGTRRHLVTVHDDDGTMTRRILVPQDLPPEYSTNAEYVIDQVRRMVRTIRSRAATAAARTAEETEWTNPVDEDQATVDAVLAQLQSEFDG